VPSLLHYLDLPEASCKARLRGRNATGEHAFAPTDAEFDLISGYFEAPVPAEGLPVVVHGGP
jgi:hypothetical protein